MRIYKVVARDPDDGVCLSWHPSKDAAEKALREWRKERNQPSDGPESVDVIDINPTRTGIIQWLNSNFTRDNG